MKSFKEYIDESYSTTHKLVGDSKEFMAANKDRVGQPVLSNKGTEVKNSLVISYGTYLLKDGSDIKIMEYNDITMEATTIVLSKQEIAMLKKFA